MAFIEWSDELSVNVDSIDRQHKTLIGYINDLAEALEHGHGDTVTADIVDSLVRYTTAHFMYEEMLFSVYNYPNSDAHKAAHSALAGKVTHYKSLIDAGNTDIGQELLTFLRAWLSHHILTEDMAYSELFSANKVK